MIPRRKTPDLPRCAAADPRVGFAAPHASSPTSTSPSRYAPPRPTRRRCPYEAPADLVARLARARPAPRRCGRDRPRRRHRSSRHRRRDPRQAGRRHRREVDAGAALRSHHEVWTGVALAMAPGPRRLWRRHGPDVPTRLAAVVDAPTCAIREMSDEEIDDYVASGEPIDKAGAYAIQGGGGDSSSRRSTATAPTSSGCRWRRSRPAFASSGSRSRAFAGTRPDRTDQSSNLIGSPSSESEKLVMIWWPLKSSTRRSSTAARSAATFS